MPRKVPYARRRPPADVRFWAKVDRRAPDECWPWLGAKCAKGYGFFRSKDFGLGRQTRAHRVAIYLASGQRPASDCVVMHACDNPPCCNPAHLSVGTPQDNSDDMIFKGRAAPPKRGSAHPTATMTETDVLWMRAERKKGRKLTAITAERGLKYQAAWAALNGRTWRHLS